MPPNPDTITCPADLDRTSKAVWKKTRAILRKDDRWRPEYSVLLERYVRAIEVGRLARQRIAEREAELAKLRPEWEAERATARAAGDLDALKRAERNLSRTAYTAWGSQGQIVPHPDLKTARDAERDANDYAKELLLTPAARQKTGEAEKGPAGPFGGLL